MSYFASNTPIGPSSASPPTARLMRQSARADRIGRLMAAGRLSNQQCQSDHSRGLSGLGDALAEEVADAPEMVPGQVELIACSSAPSEPPICSGTDSAPPWSDAAIYRPREQCFTGPGASSGALSWFDWICENPWIAIAIAAGAGFGLKWISEGTARRYGRGRA